MSYPIAAIGTDADEAKRLNALRIKTAERLLEAAKNPKGTTGTGGKDRHRSEAPARPCQ